MGNDRLGTTNLQPSTKYLSKLNAIGMIDMVAAEFIPWETIDWEQQIYNHQQYLSKLNAIGMTDMVAAEFIPWETIDWEQ